MEKTIQEIEELARKQKTKTKLDYLLKNADGDTAISVNVTLHAEQWRQILFLMTYYTEKGSRGYGSLSSTLYHIVERSYKGLLNSLTKKAREGQTQNRPKPADPSPEEQGESGEEDPFDF